MSFLVDGELISRLQTTALVFSRPRRGGLDIHHRLPGRLVGLAASLRSMPTAVSEDYQVPIHLNERFQSIHAENNGQGKTAMDANCLLVKMTNVNELYQSVIRVRDSRRGGLCHPPMTMKPSMSECEALFMGLSWAWANWSDSPLYCGMSAYRGRSMTLLRRGATDEKAD